MPKKQKDLITVKSWKENPDGSADIEVDFSEEYIEYLKKRTGKKKFSDKELERLFLEDLENSLNVLEGDLKTLKKSVKSKNAKTVHRV